MELYKFEIATKGRGFYPITERLKELVRSSGVRSGLMVIFIPHTSASIVIQEKGDPASANDMERFMTALGQQISYEAMHTWESPEDSMSHVRAVVTGCSQIIIIDQHTLVLGEWQGIFLWEHRDLPRNRQIVAKIFKDA